MHHQEILIWWRLKVKRHFCAFPYSLSCWKMERYHGGGENWGSESPCTLTLSATVQMGKASRLWKDMCSPDVNVSYWIQTFPPSLVNSLLSLNSFVSSVHKPTQILTFRPVKKHSSGYCKNLEKAQGPNRDLVQALHLPKFVNQQLADLKVSKLISVI